MSALAHAVNWIAIGCVFASAILTAAVMAVLIGRVVWDRLHALVWQARRKAAQAAPRETDMVIPRCGTRPSADAR